jgi:carboxymethylenebutenolidase
MENADARSLGARDAWTRREFVTGLVAGGFALAVQPVAADTMIVTDSKGLIAGEVEIPTADRPIPAYRAMPESEGPFPLVLVVQEIFGVHEHIRDVCRRLAKVGYMAVAPELFIRQGDVARLADIQQIIKDVVSRVPDAQVMSDLDAVVGWAEASRKGDASRVGITGFCYGGRITWLYCAHNPKVRAGVAWYGRLVGQPTELQPKFPIDVAPSLTVPVLGLYGGADQGIPLDTVEQMRQALSKGKTESEIVVYEGAPHAFHADYRPSYRKEPAVDGWRRLLAWFKTYGVEAPGVVSKR